MKKQQHRIIPNQWIDDTEYVNTQFFYEVYFLATHKLTSNLFLSNKCSLMGFEANISFLFQNQAVLVYALKINKQCS